MHCYQMWVLGDQTQVFTLAQQVVYRQNQPTSASTVTLILYHQWIQLRYDLPKGDYEKLGAKILKRSSPQKRHGAPNQETIWLQSEKK